MEKVILNIVLIFFGFTELLFCSFSKTIKPLILKIDKTSKVAVSTIYEESTGNITSLSGKLRDRIEEVLRENGYTVVVRKELGILLKEIEVFGNTEEIDNLMKNQKVNVIITGSYFIAGDRINITIKALNLKTSSIIGVKEFSQKLEKGWLYLSSIVKGNIYQRKMESVKDTSSYVKPFLKARLNKASSCYHPGESAKIYISTEKGVYIYIFCLQADGTVVMLYPNSMCKDEPVKKADFTFPNEKHQKLVLYQLKEGEPAHESFKIIASKSKIDFSSIPVAEDKIYTGLEGGDILKLYEKLRNQRGWSEVVLDYWVSEECR